MLTLKQSRRLRNALLGLLCWGIALLLFFPIFWMLLTSFKSEIDAFALLDLVPHQQARPVDAAEFVEQRQR
ncbi:hypothetical protein QOT21_29295, partial [Pseudomonas aeruginosa]